MLYVNYISVKLGGRDEKVYKIKYIALKKKKLVVH